MLNKKRAVFMSGAAMKISFLAGVIISLIRSGKKYSCFVGNSSGAILSFTMAVGKIDETEDFMMKYTQKDVFNQSPNSLKGIVSGFFRVITGKNHIFDQSKLSDTIKKVVSKRDFDRWKDDSNSPDCYVGVVDMGNGDIKYMPLKAYDYDEAINLVLASSSIPIFTKPVKMFGKILVDGGNRDHIGSATFLEKYNSKFDEITNIYSRPVTDDYFEKWSLPKRSIFGVFSFWMWFIISITPEFFYGEHLFSMLFLYMCLKNIGIIKVLLRSIEIFNLETSHNDEVITDYICKEKKIDQIKYFAPEKLTSKTYAITPEMSKYWYNLGVNEANLSFNNNN